MTVTTPLNGETGPLFHINPIYLYIYFIYLFKIASLTN